MDPEKLGPKKQTQQAEEAQRNHLFEALKTRNQPQSANKGQKGSKREVKMLLMTYPASRLAQGQLGWVLVPRDTA